MTPIHDDTAPQRAEPPVQDTVGDRVSLVAAAVVLLRQRRMIVAMGLLFFVLAAAISLLGERKYGASATFIPQRTGTSASAMSGLARQFGLNLSTEEQGQSPQFYANLIRSREILRATVEAPMPVVTDAGLDSMSLIEFWEIESTANLPAWYEASDRLKEDLSVSVDQQTDMVLLMVSLSQPKLAEAVASRLIDLVHEFNLHTRQSQAAMEAEFAAERLEVARAELIRAENALKAFLDQNRNFSRSPDLTFEHDRLQREVALRQELLLSLSQMHEQATLERLQDLPLITIVASPEDSARPRSRGTVLRGLLGLIGGLLLGAVIAFARHAWRRSRADRSPDARELERLRQESIRDLRNPFRLLRRGAGQGSA